MSGTLARLKKRMSGATDLEVVVRSMKTLAASSIGQYESAVQALGDYYRTVELGLAVCIRATRAVAGAPVARPKASLVGAIVFGSDQGLVGGFNEALLDFAKGTLDAMPGQVQKIWAVGDRMQAMVAGVAPADVGKLTMPTTVRDISGLVSEVLIDVEAAIGKRSVDEVHLFYNRSAAGSSYRCVSKQLLPLDDSWEKSVQSVPWTTRMSPQVIGVPTIALEAMIREYLFVLIFRACAESLASENATRLGAMQRAQKNIEGTIEELDGEFHRLRQQAIDEELFDVISGYEALGRDKETGR